MAQRTRHTTETQLHQWLFSSKSHFGRSPVGQSPLPVPTCPPSEHGRPWGHGQLRGSCGEGLRARPVGSPPKPTCWVRLERQLGPVAALGRRARALAGLREGLHRGSRQQLRGGGRFAAGPDSRLGAGRRRVRQGFLRRWHLWRTTHRGSPQQQTGSSSPDSRQGIGSWAPGSTCFTRLQARLWGYALLPGMPARGQRQIALKDVPGNSRGLQVKRLGAGRRRDCAEKSLQEESAYTVCFVF